MADKQATPEEAAAARAADQARLRKERREAKIKAGGANRLNKITGLGGGVQRGELGPRNNRLSGSVPKKRQQKQEGDEQKNRADYMTRSAAATTSCRVRAHTLSNTKAQKRRPADPTRRRPRRSRRGRHLAALLDPAVKRAATTHQPERHVGGAAATTDAGVRTTRGGTSSRFGRRVAPNGGRARRGSDDADDDGDAGRRGRRQRSVMGRGHDDGRLPVGGRVMWSRHDDG